MALTRKRSARTRRSLRDPAAPFKVSMHYEIWTPDDVEIGEHSKSGYEYEDEPSTMREVLRELDRHGPWTPSSSPYNYTPGMKRLWFTSADDEVNYRTGDRIVRHVFIRGPESAIRRLHAYLKAHHPRMMRDPNTRRRQVKRRTHKKKRAAAATRRKSKEKLNQQRLHRLRMRSPLAWTDPILLDDRSLPKDPPKALPIPRKRPPHSARKPKRIQRHAGASKVGRDTGRKMFVVEYAGDSSTFDDKGTAIRFMKKLRAMGHKNIVMRPFRLTKTDVRSSRRYVSDAKVSRR